MNIAWSFGYHAFNPDFSDDSMKTAWFVGGIIGAILAVLCANIMSKKLFYLLSCSLVIIGGIMFTSAPQSYTVIILARYINGIANGLIIVPCLLMAGEEAVKEVRGMIAATIETMSFGLGMYLQILFSVLWTIEVEEAISLTQIHGILVIVYGAIGLLTAAFLMIESPIHYLVHNQEQAAVESLRRLQRPHIVNHETYMILEEHKRYIAENKALSYQEALIDALPAIGKLCIYRGMLALTYSVGVNGAFKLATVFAFNRFEQWPFIVFATVRWISTLIVSIMMDSSGRKKSMINSMAFCALLAIVVAAIFTNAGTLEKPMMEAVMWLLIVFQLFAGAFGCGSSAYLSEAFPLAIKPIGIASAFITEMLVNIILLCTLYFEAFDAYFYTFACLGLVYCVFGRYCFPETMRMTLREAQAKFRGLCPHSVTQGRVM